MKTASQKTHENFSYVSLAIIGIHWQPLATMETRKGEYLVFLLVWIEGERKKGLGMDVELASQQLLFNASV